MDFHRVANDVHAGHAAATRNRFMRPAIAAWHYGSKMGLYPYAQVMLFPEPPAATKAIAPADAARLIEAAQDADQRRLLVWLFHQGTRISATLRVRWEDVDTAAGTVIVDVRKGQPARVFPLHPDVIAELSRVPEGERHGPLFRWRERGNASRALRRLSERTGIVFSPHAARHTVGTMLAAGGANQRQIMEALGHDSVKSSMRYQAGGVEMARAAQARLRIVGKR